MKDMVLLRNSIVIFFSFVVYSCGNSPTPSAYRDTQVNSIVENAEWLYFSMSPNNEVVKNGKYDKGRKNGRWSYLINGANSFEVKWQYISIDSVEMIYPDEWQLIYDSGYRFLATTPDSMSYFAIAEKAGEELSPLQYFANLYDYSLKDTSEQLMQVDGKLLSFETGKTQVFYEMRFYNGDIEYLSLGAITLEDGKIIDIAYRRAVSKDLDKIWGKVLFTEIYNNIYFKNKNLAYPVKLLKNIEDIEF